MKIAAGWLQPDYGEVSLMGKAKGRWALPEMARAGLMYVPQEQLLSPPYRVRDHFRAIVRTFGSEHLGETLAELDIEALLPLRVRTLSGGERMRVSLALALVRSPHVLLVDKPLTRLGPRDQERGTGMSRLRAGLRVCHSVAF